MCQNAASPTGSGRIPDYPTRIVARCEVPCFLGLHVLFQSGRGAFIYAGFMQPIQAEVGHKFAKEVNAVWPMLARSHSAVTLILLKLATADARAALRLLQKSMYRPLLIITMVALLCFWTCIEVLMD